MKKSKISLFILGNQCKKLMMSTDALRDVVPEEHRNFCDALDKFDVLAQDCFGKYLAPGYLSSIKAFHQSFTGLGFKTKSTKLHILFAHVPEYLEKTGVGLAIDSEQAGESLHSRFTEFSRYKLPKSFHKANYNHVLA